MKRVTPQEQPKRSVLLYGPPKSGKTAGACSAPGPVLLLNCDLPNASYFAHKQQDDLIEVQYENFNDTLVAIAGALKKDDLTFGGLSKKPIQTVVVDPIGELYRKMLEEFSQGAVSPTLPTYNTTQVHLERFCRMMCESQDVNFVLTAHEFPVHDDASGETEKLLWAGTKSNSATLSQKLMGMVDVIGYTGVMEKEDGSFDYVAQLVNGKGRRGGDRFDSLVQGGEVTRTVNLKDWFKPPTAAERKAA